MYDRPLSKTGVLLINLGTPRGPGLSAVRRYLKEFLSDPYVIDLPTPLRQLLLYGLILPFRAKKSARAYQSIWTDAGSPLLIHMQALRAALSEQLGSSFLVSLGMRYEYPSLAEGLKILLAASCSQLIIFPVFPQYSKAATETALRKVEQLLTQWKVSIPVLIKPYFFDEPLYIDALAAAIRENKPEFGSNHYLFSYHGLPERQLAKEPCQASGCDRIIDCPLDSSQNKMCYRAQCFMTSHLLSKQLQLSREQYSVTFQSRVGGAQWIRPYTDQTLVTLAERGIKNITIACPSFVVDCLETLEEIGIRAREQWRSLGGQNLHLIPSLNSHPIWINALAKMINDIST
jgi:ferrochelatase